MVTQGLVHENVLDVGPVFHVEWVLFVTNCLASVLLLQNLIDVDGRLLKSLTVLGFFGDFDRIFQLMELLRRSLLILLFGLLGGVAPCLSLVILLLILERLDLVLQDVMHHFLFFSYL